MRALILGACGQDGSYLAEHLVAAGHEVFGLTRHPRNPVEGVTYLQGAIRPALERTQPDEIYNLTAVTSPGGAWGATNPPGLVEVNVGWLVDLLDAAAELAPAARIVHASSSAIYDPHRYGLYGVTKRAAHDIVTGYRTGRGMHVSNAVLYSHASPRQDPRFLAPTICRKLRAIAEGGADRLVLTDVIGRRDWGFAGDFAAALPIIAEAEPGDYVVGTGRQHSVGEFVSIALDALGLEPSGAVDVIQGIPAPAEHPADSGPLRELGWKPATSFDQMVREMVA